ALLCVLTPGFRHAVWGEVSSGAEAKEEAEALPQALVLRSLDVHLQPPAYTGLPERTLEHLSGEIRVQEGTQVRVAGETYPTVEDAWITHEDPEREDTPLRVHNGQQFEGAWIASRDDT